MKMIGRVIGLCLVSLLTLGAIHQASANTPFYFIAKPVHPITGVTPNAPVYLRWDTLESNLPNDVARIELLRDGQVLINTAVDQVKSAAEIMAIYQRPGQERQLRETLTRLQELALSEGKTFNPSNYASDLRERIVSDSAYAYLASRQDFNIALARNRAFIDQSTGNNSYSYELVAINGSGVRARLGLITVDMTKSYQVLTPGDFKQAAPSRCDSPDYFKYNYSVALDWKSPGEENQIDTFTSDVAIAGYDLYRLKDNLLASVQTPPERDIAALSAVSPSDAQGQWILPGVEKVNSLPLMINADGTDEPEWLETKDQLIAAGLKPGDRRAYYLVPKDFTGQYGKTISTIIVVPNLVRPETPWNISLFADETKINSASDRMTMSWDAVNYQNFIDTQLGQKQICNAQEAEQTGFVEYVNQGESCQADVRRSIRVNADGYLVYRFESFEQASRFKDSDGDGAADLAEQTDQIQCNSEQQPQNTPSYLINPQESAVAVETYTIDNITRKRISVDVADSEKGQVYWYRIASKTNDGRLSFLSQPIRALFPNRNLPDKPTVEVAAQGEKVCGCRAEIDSVKATDSLVNVFIPDYQGNYTLSCDGADTAFTSNEFSRTGLACTKTAQTCTANKEKSLSLDGTVVTNSSAPYAFSCSVNFPSNFDLCGTRALKVSPEYCDGFVPLATGELVAGPVLITAKAPEGSCVSIYRSVGGDSARVGTSCGTDNTASVEVGFDQGLFCGYAVSHDENNNISQSQVIPCVLVQNTNRLTPSAPQLVDLSIESDSATVFWRNPIEPVAVTLIELVYTDKNGATVTSGVSAPSAGQGSATNESFEIPFPNLTESEGRLCVRLRAVSPNAKNTQSQSSSWSAQSCKDIVPQGQVVPDYLPWPVGQPISQGENTKAHYGFEFLPQGKTYGIEAVFVDLFDFEISNSDCEIKTDVVIDEAIKRAVFPTIKCTVKTKTLFETRLKEYASFMVYRQSGGVSNPSDWIQVTPLIDYVHWEYAGKGSLKVPKPPESGRLYQLNDPFVKLYSYIDSASQLIKWRAAVLDPYPYSVTEQYRYQIVYFDDTHRIVHWRLTDWVDFESVVDDSRQ